jgi:hypothetical protein
MRGLITVLGCTLGLIAGAAPAQAQPTKTVSGTVTAISANSVTVKTGDQDMTFAIDAKTRVIAPGGTTKTKTAVAEGKSGPVLTDFLKDGEAVQIRYHEQGMHAAEIRKIASVSTGPKSETVSGVVSAVSADSVTVKGKTGEWTFTVDAKTTITGSGLGTAAKKMESEGKKPTLSDTVHEGDTVVVTYHDLGATKHAASVRVTQKKG